MSEPKTRELCRFEAPIATKRPYPITNDEFSRIDDYYWMNNPENQEVIDYLNAENDYLEKTLGPLNEDREAIFKELKSRIKEKDESVPYLNGSYYYYSKFNETGEYPLYCRKKTLDGQEEILLNGNELAIGHEYFNIGGFEISDNEQLMAFGVDTLSRRNYTLKFKNLLNETILDDTIECTEGGDLAWAADNKTVFYILRDQQTLMGNRVYRHEIGTNQNNDVLVYEEKDPQFYLSLTRSKSKKYIFINSSQNGVSNEYLLLNAENPTESYTVFKNRQNGLEYSIEHFQNKFFIRTNLNSCPNFKMMEVLESKCFESENWLTIVAHSNDVFIENFEVFDQFLAIQERKSGLVNLKIIDLYSQKIHYIEFEEPSFDVYFGTNMNFNTKSLRFVYNSLTTPASVFDYDMKTKTKSLLKEQAVLGSFSKSNYKAERIYVKSRDGVEVPVSIVYHINTTINGTAPLLQYAYGSYGMSIDATFNSNRLSLLDRGFVYAICHVRGGQEMGRKWYDDGKMFHKKNTFNDFMDCSKSLIAQKYAAPKLLFAMGGSAGGLLMGVIANQAPNLYHGIVAQVPFVDVVTTMLDETIPLTTGEFEEWGNPKNAESYRYMLSYSPYDNVSAIKYPNLLVTSGLYDSQVQYWEPTKWVAKIRTLKTNDNLLLLNTNMKAGHGGASGRYSVLKDTALVYVFLLYLAQKL